MDEMWDIYDKYGKKTGRVIPRSEITTVGDYHLVVHVWESK